jgi:aromatic-L-amino-acid/L-tryptophan decarboxylase
MVSKQEITLDPENWDEYRKIGYKIIDDIILEYQNAGNKNAFHPFKEELLERTSTSFPADPMDPLKVYEDLRILRETQDGNGFINPRAWGWVMGTGAPVNVMAGIFASGYNIILNSNMAWNYHIEKQAINWIKEMLDYPMSSSGIFTSGASMANLTCLTVARNTKAQVDIRKQGIQSVQSKMIVYGSEEMHSCHQKNVEVLGLGEESLVRIPVNDKYQIKVDELENAIKRDIEKGHQPFCIIGNAGTTNTGSFDDLNELRKICDTFGLWLHVDGAFGAWLALTTKYKHFVDGMTKADSIALDLHKWMSASMGTGCALVRDSRAHYNAFSLMPDYLRHDEELGPWIQDLGIEMSREWRGLKVWMSLKEHGVRKHGKIIEQNVDQTQYFVDRVKKHPNLELMAPAPVNVVCFRYCVDGLSEDDLDELNGKILVQSLMGGKVFIGDTKIRGRTALRFGHVNHRSKTEDFDILYHEITRLGHELTEK